jgi:hypothetical protein
MSSHSGSIRDIGFLFSFVSATFTIDALAAMSKSEAKMNGREW